MIDLAITPWIELFANSGGSQCLVWGGWRISRVTCIRIEVFRGLEGLNWGGTGLKGGEESHRFSGFEGVSTD